MKADLAAKLQIAMRGGAAPKTGGAGVTGVAGVSATCTKSLTLQPLRQLRVKNTKLANDVIRGVVGGVAVPPEPDEAEIEERKGMTMCNVPERYLDAWPRFQLQCPGRVTEQAWRQAIDDAGRFLDQLGKLADSFGWTPGDLFDVPRDGATGLVWWLRGRPVTSLGPEHAGSGDPAYDRVTRRDWVNPYARPVRPVSLSPILEHQLKIMQRVLGR